MTFPQPLDLGTVRREAHTSATGRDKITALECLPFGKVKKTNGNSPFLVGKSTIIMAIFNSYLRLPKGKLPTNDGPIMAQVSSSYVGTFGSVLSMFEITDVVCR